MAEIALDVLEPFAPLGAGALWIAQPVLSIFLPRADIATWAQQLDDPGAFTGVRKALEEQGSGDQNA